MKNRANSALALTLAIACAVAAPLRSGAAERTAQMSLHLPKQGEFTAVELFSSAGGLSIGLESAGIPVVTANEIVPDFVATLAANHQDANVTYEDIHILETA